MTDAEPKDALPPVDPERPLEDFFKEGLAARDSGLKVRDNPYAAGSVKRREWHAGFCATAETEDEDDLALDPNEDAKRRSAD